MSITFIDKTDLQNPEKKKRKLLDPHFKDHGTLGLNILNSVWTILA